MGRAGRVRAITVTGDESAEYWLSRGDGDGNSYFRLGDGGTI